MVFPPINENNGEQNLKHKLSAEYLLLSSSCDINQMLMKQNTFSDEVSGLRSATKLEVTNTFLILMVC